MLRVWGRRNSANVQKVLWLVGELGLAHDQISVGGPFGGLNEPAFRAINPHGRIPVLQDGPVTVWESHAILRYLAARHGADRFWSGDPAVRAFADQWMDWAQTRFQVDFLDGVFWGFYRTPESQRDWPQLRKAMARCADHAILMDNFLKNRVFLGGEQLSLADIAFGSLLYRYFNLDIDHPSVPGLGAYYERLCARPTYREHVMVPFDELKGRLSF